MLFTWFASCRGCGKTWSLIILFHGQQGDVDLVELFASGHEHMLLFFLGTHCKSGGQYPLKGKDELHEGDAEEYSDSSSKLGHQAV